MAEKDYDDASDVQAKMGAVSGDDDGETTVVSEAQLADIAERWRLLRHASPKIRIYDAAQTLGVSELTLRATQFGTATATRLDIEFEALVHELPKLGRVVALSRNHAVVHETRGTYGGVGFEHHMGIVHHDDIDLRLFMSRWAHALAIEEAVGSETRHSIHVYDAEGTAIHKVVLKPRSNHDHWASLVKNHAAEDQSRRLELREAPARPEKDDADIDVDALREGWRGMKDTHDFFPLTHSLGVAREQALRLGPDEFVSHARPDALERVLKASAAAELPIMIFVGNPGIVQIYTGTVSKVVGTDEWVNVLDPVLHLHARRAHLARSYIVRKPTEDGIVTSLEVFDASGELIVQCFGERKPGRAEREGWRDVVEQVALA